MTNSTAMIDVRRLPMWSPWVVISKGDKLTGQVVCLDSHLTKNEAWHVARTEQARRPNVIAIAVRRDDEQF